MAWTIMIHLKTNILSLYNTLAPLKKKVVMANHKTYVTKNLRKGYYDAPIFGKQIL